MSARMVPGEHGLGIAGLIAAALALALLLLDPRAALTGWLAAAVFIQGLPIGALAYLLMMRLMRGRWEADLRGPARLTLALLPLGALALVPPLIGMGAVYPWFTHAPESAFAAFWLNPAFFVLRTVAWFAFAWIAAGRVRREMGEGLAAGLLIVLFLGATFLATDWLMTLDPKFASSGFGLQIFSLEMTAALAALILLRLAAGDAQNPGVLGALLLTLLLLWAYFQFMPFLIVWSGNLPDVAGWYLARDTIGWQTSLAVAGLLGGVPLLALLFPAVRGRSLGLRLCAASVLAGKAIEFGWFTLPGRGFLAVVCALLALIGLGCLALALLLRAARRAETSP